MDASLYDVLRGTFSDGRRVETRPIAGTSPRGTDEEAPTARKTAPKRAIRGAAAGLRVIDSAQPRRTSQAGTEPG